jgi:hypothetical protein
MKKFTLILTALLFAVIFTQAQTQERNCGTMDYLQKQIAADPSIKTAMDNLELWTDNWIKNNPNYDAKTAITIPVVVHIIYSTTAQNISDSRVVEQINASNTDFLGQNAHSMGSFSTTLKANANIQFCLAQRKPDGTATNGIESRQTTHANFGAANNDERHTSTGGMDAWDVTKYFNIWVCDLGSSLCGYSQFPYASSGGGVNATYGSSINYQFFGITGAVSPYNLGGTLTHEVGHCLNLFHIWGDDNGACTGTDNCADTPNQANSTTGHHTGTLTDGCTSAAPGIMYQNFMDYSDDQDYANFTPNQVARIQALFVSGGPLYSLTTSNGCTAPSGTSCGTASGLTVTSITATTATFGWTAVSGASSYNIQYRKTGTTTWTSTTSTTNSKSITGLTASTSYEYQIQTVCTSGSSSFTSSSTFTTLSSGGSSCSDIYESNNTQATAKSIAANTSITAMIGTSTDVDYFKFTNTSTMKNIKVTLSGLPLDYDMKLYNSAGTLLATSQNGGTTAEAIKYNNAPVGTYYIRIYGYGGVYSATSCYSLIANISSSSYKLEGDENSDANTPVEISLYPNPANNLANVSYNTDKDCNITLRLIDITGRIVSETNYTASKGLNTYSLDLTAVLKGLYIVELSSGSEVIVKKLLVDK